MSYKPQSQIDLESSPVYAVRHWRKTGTAEETLDEFLFWLEYDMDSPDTTSAEELKSIKALIDEYLGRDMQKIKQGERQLLDAWIRAAQGVNRTVE